MLPPPDNLVTLGRTYMQTFGELLKDYIKKQKLTVYQLSKDTGIDRSFLQGVLSNKRKLPQKRFTDIINTSFFTANQIHDLCNIYYTEKFGEDKMKRINYINSGFTGNIKKGLDQKIDLKPIRIEINTFYSGKNEILSVISQILNNDKTHDFYSNFSFSHKEINNIVYRACKEGKIQSFFHYVSENDGTDCKNIEILFNSLHYAEKGYYTYIYSPNTFSSLFPYFILTDEYLLQFDNNADNAYLINADIIGTFVIENLKHIKQIAKKNVIITENAFDLMNQMQIHACFDNLYNTSCFDNTFVASYITREIIQEIATPVIKNYNIDRVINQLSSHYKFMLGKANIQNQIFTYQAIDNFIKTGRIDNFPEEYAYPVPKNMRKPMLEAIIKNSCHFQMTNPQFFNTSYSIAFQINNNTLLFNTCDDISSQGAYLGKVMYSTENEIIVNDFIDYLNYISTCEKTYSIKASKNLLQNLICGLEE